MQESYNIAPIAIARTDYSQKFAIPRQSGLVENIGYIELLSPYARYEAVSGLEDFSHIWLIFGFHKNIDEKLTNKTLVNPPKYPDDKKVGIFASRSPHRPNHLGLSLVKLLEIQTSANQVLLKVEGIDLLDKTPIFDIKPYLPKLEIRADAKAYGVCPNSKNNRVFAVEFSEQPLTFLQEKSIKDGKEARDYLEKVISQSLHLDPRPKQEQDNYTKTYSAQIANCDIKFCFRERKTSEQTQKKLDEKTENKTDGKTYISTQTNENPIFIEVVSIKDL